ncbi:hypothetical protein ACVOMT_16505 [Sphingomonas panni]
MDSTSITCALEAAVHALRSYQHGNGTPDLAAAIADAGEYTLQAAGYQGLVLAREPVSGTPEPRQAKVVREALVKLAFDAEDKREAIALVAIATRAASPAWRYSRG